MSQFGNILRQNDGDSGRRRCISAASRSQAVQSVHMERSRGEKTNNMATKSASIPERDVGTWEEFEKELRDLRQQVNSPLLFRGQSNSCWPLTTTLEREGREQQAMLFKDYYRIIDVVRTQIESFTDKRWPIPHYPTVERWVKEYDLFSLKLSFGRFPAYAYMVHLRHHGFPSPLLDWTRSQHVAAYFAFSKARDDAPDNANNKKVSIHVFSEETFRIRGNRMPLIFRLGPYVRTHRRHFLQQCEYTLCVSFDDEWRFEQYQKVFEWPSQSQASVWKFNLPYAERLKVLKLLDEYNLNAFSLFGSEESLMETMALKGLHFCKSS
jgi:hypothetical protein